MSDTRPDPAGRGDRKPDIDPPGRHYGDRVADDEVATRDELQELRP